MDDLPRVLVRMGCPEAKAPELAAGLERRAQQLAAARGRSLEDALAHLLGLMRQGWAAQAAADSPPPPTDSQSQAPLPGFPQRHLQHHHHQGVIRPWTVLRSTPVGDFRVFRLRTDEKVSPRTGRPHEFFVIDSVNWVNIIALTASKQLVMIEQYRHGTNTVELEIPGGMMDPGELSPERTAERELREETGYEGTQPRRIGQIFPNPAIMSNTCYTVLVEGCELKHATDFDHGEDLVTRLVDPGEIPELIAAGRIRHSLVVVALYHFELWQRGLPTQDHGSRT
jgi:8-oxo-dGTP pyrophosphatase MutT (NUDIX family)